MPSPNNNGRIFTPNEVAWNYLHRLAAQRPECFGNPAYFPAKLAEEVGEAVKQANARLGFSRHAPVRDLEAEELADIVISAYAQAITADIDLDAAIQKKHTQLMNRSWEQEGAPQ